MGGKEALLDGQMECQLKYEWPSHIKNILAVPMYGKEKANEELGLTKFKTPEEYLAMDDYTVWTALKDCEKSSKIIDLEKRKLLKCAYERTFYEKDTMISNIFGREAYRRQVQVPVVYGDIKLPDCLRLDVLVEEKIICELKVVDSLNEVHQAQLLSQMKLN
jgi:GxxExxY protein